jgi:protein O-GlcNAc transferase
MSQRTTEQWMQTARRHHEARQWGEAEKIYRGVLARHPKHAEALNLLGMLQRQTGRSQAAVDTIRQAIAIKPDYAAAHNNLGSALQSMGRFDEAIAAYRQAIGLKADYADAHYHMGIALKATGRLDEAAAAYREAIRCHPGFPEAHTNLGNILKHLGQLDQAIASHQEAIRLRPDYADAHYNLGNTLREAGQIDQAIASLRRAVQIKPDLAEGHVNLGNLLKDAARFDEALSCHRQAIAVRPELAEAHSNLGNVYSDTGLVEQAIVSYRHALSVKPDAAAHSNLLYALLKHPAFDPKGLLEESREWNRRHGEALARQIRAHSNERDPDRRLRIGYISPDFRVHSVSRFALPLLAAHDRMAFEIFAYAQVRTPDTMTAQVRSRCDTWRDIVGLSDERVAEMIREDRIDILIDLAGHTSGNRLLVFARKPAPVQVTWLGYPGTTGLSAMDYRLTDAHADPPGAADGFCTEQLIRLPQTAWCFHVPSDSPAVNELPAVKNGRVTFGSFNSFAKMNEPLLKLWAKILLATPGSRLLLKAKPLACASVQERVRHVMSSAGVEAERVEMFGWAAPAEHLGQYGRVDIALDTYPYHGTTTTCEAMWMGVPVVSLAGESHVSRVGVSLLTNAGLPELIAESPEEYVRIAAELAGDLPRLEELCGGLRARMMASPLMEAPRFARDMEAAYRQMWRTWCG